jgi:translation initiation factor 1A
MVKNTKGGSGHKKMGSKNINNPKVNQSTRIATDECEYYGFVMNLLGGSNCHVMCQDGIKRLCVIRGIFRGGKGKRDSFITRGSWILVGIREWSTENKTTEKLNKCDLLEVYNEQDKTKLKTIPGIDWNLFINNDIASSSYSSSCKDDGIEFTYNVVEKEYQDLVNSNSNSNSNNNISMTIKESTEELDIDIDDI